MKLGSLSALGIIFRWSWSVARRRLLIGSGLLLAGALAQPGIALSVRTLSDQVVNGAAGATLVALCCLLTTCLVGQLLLGHFAHLWYFELGEVVETELNVSISRAIHRGQPLDFIEQAEVADGIDLARSDVGRTRTTVEASIGVCVTAVQLTATCTLLLWVSPWLLLLPAVAALPVLLGERIERPVQQARIQTATAARSIRQMRQALSIPAMLQESRLGTGVARLTSAHDESQRALAVGLNRGYDTYAAYRLAIQIPLIVGFIAAITWTAVLASRNLATAGDVLMVLTLTTQLGAQLANAIGQLAAIATASAGLRRIEDLARHAPVRTAPATAPPTLRVGLRFEDVTYRYPASQQTSLSGINLDLPAGATVAIVGENGAGKSTLIRLIQGLCRPTEGSILLDGIDLTTIRDYHAHSSALFQDFARFSLTLAESIGMGDIDRMHDPDAVLQAIERASASRLLREIGSLQTPLGPDLRNGRELSGGQWQTLALARALMHESPLVLTLDEPGHFLDPQAELHMIDAYEKAARAYGKSVGSLVIYVTHRLSSVRTADYVLVLRNGRVEAIGTHEELIAKVSYYRDLFDLQARTYS